MSEHAALKWPTLAIGLVVLFLSAIIGNGAAQADVGSVLVTTLTEDGILIFEVDATGQQTLVASLPEFRVGEPVSEDLWYLENASRLTVSLDGTQLAFTAQRAGGWALFTYGLLSNSLQQIPIPNQLVPFWSPDSSAVLLTVNSSEPQYDLEPPFNDYVYELNTQSLNQITDEPERIEWNMNWLPDSSGLFYVGHCDTCTSGGYELYFTNRDGTGTRILTNVSSLPLADSFPFVCHPTWSEPNKRIYYIVGCVGGGDESNEYLYSVDLAGNVRAEIDDGLNSVYPEEYSIRTQGMHPSPFTSDVYLTIASQGGDGTGLSNWRGLRLSAPNEIVAIYEQTMQNDDLDSSSMSPDGASIALLTYGSGASNGFLEVIDLATGQRIIGRGATPLDVCEATWEDDHTLFYTVDSTGECTVDRGPRSVWVLDTASGATHEVTGGLGENVSMVRQVVVTSPVVVTPTPTPTYTPSPTPTPSATPTPAAFQRLRVTAICSDDPAISRRWRIRNPNPYPVPFTWEMRNSPSGQQGTGTAPVAVNGVPSAVILTTATERWIPVIEVAANNRNDFAINLGIPCDLPSWLEP